MSENNPSIIRTLEQQRAAHAWQQVQAGKTAAKQKELKSLARSAPASIQSSGLGQTVAFWKAKGEDHHRVLYAALEGWLKDQLHFSASLLEWIASQASSADYRYATAEAQAYLSWYKRFAEAELEGE
ncbi:type III-B CRISPR module-associated protein Cmr5 [Bellilinea sp.]|uniref:type III-B CRISPR module-associated protein Cmr5 n=1 Tax=Bellilinea sp. TaxID=2838785 RepID=UPI002ADD43A8|nr:type III-B CRISPR module-associated protein Cmr5 [Bellilinea sp.]